MGEQSLTITKGVAAVFIVLSLSGAPVFLRDSLSQFSLPLLMLCTGYSLSNSKHENKLCVTRKNRLQHQNGQ